MNIDSAFDILMSFEGGDKLVDNPNDAGGLTKYGISQTAYPKVDIANLTEDAAKAIYATDYWNAANCAKVKPELQYVVFDSAVNMGVVTAIKILQEAAGVTVDGIFGPETMMKSDNVTIGEYLLLREIYDAEIVVHRKDQIEFLGGWSNRNKAILSLYKQGKLN